MAIRGMLSQRTRKAVGRAKGGKIVKLSIDHLTLAGPDLDQLQQPFREMNLQPDYGGPHENGVTHMALLGFADGSYLEFFSPRVAGATSPIWDDFIVGSAGPSAWAIASEQAGPLAEKLRAQGLTVRGPLDRGRKKPDGTALRWQMVFIGDGSPGAFHPFVVQDLTPRPQRVSVSACAQACGVHGIEAIMLAVTDTALAIHEMRRAYDLDAPRTLQLPGLDATAFAFRDAPLIVATPAATNTALSRRLARFGAAPCGVIFSSDGLNDSARAMGLPQPAGPKSLLRLHALEQAPGTFFGLVQRGSLI